MLPLRMQSVGFVPKAECAKCVENDTPLPLTEKKKFIEH